MDAAGLASGSDSVICSLNDLLCKTLQGMKQTPCRGSWTELKGGCWGEGGFAKPNQSLQDFAIATINAISTNPCEFSAICNFDQSLRSPAKGVVIRQQTHFLVLFRRRRRHVCVLPMSHFCLQNNSKRR